MHLDLIMSKEADEARHVAVASWLRTIAASKGTARFMFVSANSKSKNCNKFA